MAVVRRHDGFGILRDSLLGQGGFRSARLSSNLPRAPLQLPNHGQRQFSIATGFFYASLWRWSGAMTDLEFYEIRFSGKAASAVRGFRAIYLGLLFNCLIMASVNLAACKIAGILF